jgi:carboxypeptidase Taq
MSFSKYRDFYKTIQLFRDIESVLHWDSEVMMPQQGREYRSLQIAEISRFIHEKFTGSEFGNIIQSAIREISGSQENSTKQKLAELKWIQSRREKTGKLPAEFVQKLSQKSSIAHGIWQTAKKESDFSKFAPILAELVDLALQRAEYYGFETEPYDSLLDDYETGAKATELDQLFSDLKRDLIPLVGMGKKTENPFSQKIPEEHQEKFCKSLPARLGLPADSSRLDKSAHPFSTSLGPKDKRITTRYDESDPLSAIFGVLHEVGHSLYEAGLSEIEDGPHPFAEFLSLGIHESQSRLWENHLGRSKEFWEFYYPKALEVWGLTESDLPFSKVYSYIRSVSPSKIRVEADPLTYNIHIILRFEMERDLINRKIKVKDLPEIWNQKMKDYMGIQIVNDAEGVLQDIHWSMGAFGYFPTYTLGNLYAAQFYEAFLKENPEFPSRLKDSGDVQILVDWLRKNVHHKGRTLSVPNLIRESTGSEPSAKPLLRYLEDWVRQT